MANIMLTTNFHYLHAAVQC